MIVVPFGKQSLGTSKKVPRKDHKVIFLQILPKENTQFSVRRAQ